MNRATIQIFLGIVVAVMGGVIFPYTGWLSLVQIVAGAGLATMGALRAIREVKKP
jgi:hypothetical protein